MGQILPDESKFHPYKVFHLMICFASTTGMSCDEKVEQ